MTTIHPTAIVDQGARLEAGVEVGPYAVIGRDVTIGAGTRIGAHCHVEGRTTLGRNNHLFPFVSIGCAPQDIKYKGEPSAIEIGDGNTIREYVTIHRAEGEGHKTVIANENLFMAYVHIAHNCQVGSHNILANGVTLAGHVHIGNRMVLGGLTGIHQFCHLGDYVMIGGMSKIVKDVPPYIKVDGNPARVVGLNAIGLKRNNLPKEAIDAIRVVYRVFFRSGLNVTQAIEEMRRLPEAASPHVRQFLDFIAASKRGIYKRVRESITE